MSDSPEPGLPQCAELHLNLLRSLAFFLAAVLYKIGGGYMVWLWLRDHRSPCYAVVGAVLLVL